MSTVKNLQQKISIITPCYNQEAYVAETLQSIFNQNYNNLQYIFVDGASTDNTLEIVNGYKEKIDVLISEPDEGQYPAVNKGMSLAEGEIMAWLNADDMYFPWTFSIVNEIFERFPDVHWITGLPSFINDKGQCIRMLNNPVGSPRDWIANGWFRFHLGGYLMQESMFWRKTLWEKAGGLNETLKLASDFDLWTRFAKQTELVTVSVPLAAFRMLPGRQRSSLQKDVYEREIDEICRKLKKPNTIWNYLASKGFIMRSLCRLVQIRRAPVISYSRNGCWTKRNIINTISKVSLPAMKVEYDINQHAE